MNLFKIRSLSFRINLWIIDTDPIFLGLFARFGGVRQDKLIEYNESIEKKIEERTRELKVAKEEAEESNRAKSEFLSSMSHELRTPLNAISGFAQILKMNTENNLTTVQLNNIDRIYAAGKHLLKLINEVLDLSSIESGRIKLSMETIDMKKFMGEIKTIVELLVIKDEIEFILDSAEFDSHFLHADRLRLKQVVLNLISNGIKYNIRGESLRIYKERREANMIRLVFEDTGIGIPREKWSQVFQLFNRLGKETMTIEGTGIGLSITKKIVEMMDGQIDFESEEGVGSKFFVDLPIPGIVYNLGV